MLVMSYHSNADYERTSKKGLAIVDEPGRVMITSLRSFILVTQLVSTVHFSSAFQWDSGFLHLCDQKIGERDTYVIAFAQLPGEARNTVTMEGQGGVKVQHVYAGDRLDRQGKFSDRANEGRLAGAATRDRA